MFRKPGAAKRALGILASSQNLMNAVEPVRMNTGGYLTTQRPTFSRLQELQRELNSLVQARSRYGSGTMIGRGGNSPTAVLDARIAQKTKEIQDLGRQVAAQNVPVPATTGRPVRDIAAGIVAGNRAGARGLETVFDTAVDANKAFARFAEDTVRDAGAAVQRSGIVPAVQAAAETVAADPMGTARGSALGPVIRAAETVAADPMGTAKASALGPAVKSAEIGLKELVDDPVGFTRKAGALIGEGLFGLPQEAERRKALEGTTLEEKMKEAQVATIEQLRKKQGEEPKDAAEKSALQEGLDTLAANAIEGKERDKSDLLIRIGLGIMAGEDSNALTNIAKGTLLGLESYRNEELARDKMAPDIVKTLKAFKEAGVTDPEQQNALLMFTLQPSQRSGQNERMVTKGYAALAQGDLATARGFFESAGVDADAVFDDYTQQIKRAQTPAAAATSSEDKSFLSNFNPFD